MKLNELKKLYELPFFDLIEKSRKVYKENWGKDSIQLCTLLSIKTGRCSEDCAYCSQSSHYKTDLESEKLMDKDEVLKKAIQAKDNGTSRFCMGAAWKGVKEGDAKLDHVLDIVREVSKLGLEVCVTLGELTSESAKLLKEAGVTAYNHNLDTSPEFYPKIVTTHTYKDRLNTIKHVQDQGMSLCCGGIIGMGEAVEDRLKLIEVVSEFSVHPESFPINCLVPIPGTPLSDTKPLEIFEIIRMIALSRISLPKTRIRLSAGRTSLSKEAQALAFFSGANSIFYGNKLLTTKNTQEDKDMDLIKALGIDKSA